MESEYALSEAFEERIKNAYTEPKTFPIWIADSNNFWYRRKIQPAESCFMFVDPEHGISRPLFDHARLAKALNGRGIEAKAHKLPFTWIDPSNEGEGDIRFRIGAAKFRFSKDCRLSDYDGDINENILKPLSKEKASEPPTDATSMESIEFVNFTARSISVFRIDHYGKLCAFTDIKAGESLRKVSRTGDVWRVTDAETKMMIGSFCGGDYDPVVIVEEDMKIITKPIDRFKVDLFTMEESPKEQDSNGLSSKKTPNVFVKDYNFWYRHADQKETQLSTNGTKDNIYDESKICVAQHFFRSCLSIHA